MPRPRKTVELLVLTQKVNRILAATADELSAERAVVASLLCDVLIECDAYSGFRYVGEGNEAGAIDETRRSYYAPKRS